MKRISLRIMFFVHMLLLVFSCKKPGPYDSHATDYFVNRDTLIYIANQWFDGKGQLAKEVRQTINGIESEISLPKMKFSNRVFFCDTQKSQVSAWANRKNDLYQVRLAVRKNQITEIEVYDVFGISRNMEALKGEYCPRDELIRIVNIYFDALVNPGNPVPFDKSVVRYEMGIPLCISSAICNAEHIFFGYLFRDVIDRRFVVDEENGVIVAYIFFELIGGIGGMTAVESFKIIDGRIYEVHAYWKFKLSVVDPGWDGGNIITTSGEN